MAAQGDHVDCARLLMYYKAPVDDVTVVSYLPYSYAYILFECDLLYFADPKVHERYCRVLPFCIFACAIKQGTI